MDRSIISLKNSSMFDSKRKISCYMVFGGIEVYIVSFHSVPFEEVERGSFVEYFLPHGTGLCGVKHKSRNQVESISNENHAE